MAKVTIYTSPFCSFCMQAKALLKKKGVQFEEIDITEGEDTMPDLVRRTGRRTVPQIFVNDAPIGGFEELKALDDSGKLDSLLAA